MPTCKKYARRFLSEREILAGLDLAKAPRRAPRNVRAEVWRWANGGRDGLEKAAASFASLRADERTVVVDHWTAPLNRYVIESAAKAAENTLPAYASPHGPKFYTQHQFMTAYCFMLWLNLGFRALNARLYSPANFEERLLVFGKLRCLPHPLTARRFVRNLTPEQWQRFLQNLQTTNPDLALILESRHVSE